MNKSKPVITKNKVLKYLNLLKKKGYSDNTIKRKTASLLKFTDYAFDNKLIHHNQFQEIKNILLGKKSNFTLNFPKPKIAGFKALLPKLRFTNLLGLFLLIAFAVGSGIGIYNQFFRDARINLAAQPGPVRAGRIINFQGFLTDSNGTPIVSPINMRYKLYNADSGGDVLYDTGSCSVSPDNDGIVNVLIGTNSPAGGACWDGNEIPAEVFSMNPNVYLGVTVGTDPEMTDRQQIANVGYAINAELLQGYPLGTSSASVPFINGDGDLLIAATTPSVSSINTSANFRLSSANAITIASAGSGDILLQASESGAINLRTGGITDAYSRLYITNSGNVGIGTTTPSSKLDVNGTVTMSGLKLTTSPSAGYVLSSDASGNGTWTDVSSTAGPWTLASNNLYPDSTNYNVGIGATNPGTAKLYVNGNVGIGTTAPGGKLDIYDGTYGSALKVSQSANDYLQYQSRNFSINATNSHNNPFSFTLNSSGTDFAIQLGQNTTYDLTTRLVSSNGYSFKVGNITESSATTAMYLSSDANVGIGTTAPAYKLDVSGDVYSSANLRAATDLYIAGTALSANSSTTSGASKIGLYKDTMTYVTADTNVQNAIKELDSAIGTISGGSVTGTGTTNYVAKWSSASGLTDSSIYDTGNVGIGTTTPGAYKLNVVGNTYLDGTLNITGAITAPTSTNTINNLIINSGALSGVTGYTQTSGALAFSGGGNFSVDSAAFDVTTGGAVSGVTTLSMNNQLTNSYANTAAINLTGNASGITFGGTGVNQIITGGTNALALMPGGNVGIGTTAPGYKLDVGGTTQTEDLRLTGLSSGTSDTILTLNGSDVESRDIGDFLLPSGSFGQTLYYNTSWTATSNLYNDGGNIGIGTVTPGSLLSVAGGISVGTTYSGYTAPANGALFEGRIGIGNTNPSYWVHIKPTVEGTVFAITETDSNNRAVSFESYANGGKIIAHEGSNAQHILSGVGESVINESGRSNLDFRIETDNQQYAFFVDAGTEKIGFNTNLPAALVDIHGTTWLRGAASGTSGLFVNADGNVGIGTTVPADYRLTVDGNTNISGNITSATWQGNVIGLAYGGTNKNITASAGSIVYSDSDSFELTGVGTSGYLLSSTGTGAPTWTDPSTLGTNYWTLSGSNLYPNQTTYNVGVGTTTPGSLLSVAGGLSVGSTYAAVVAPINGAIFEGSVGIGTTNPNFLLDIKGDSGGRFINTSLNSGIYIDPVNNRIGTNFIANNLTLGGANNLIFETYDSGWTPRMYISNTGNVGIGTTAPGYKLHVNGNVGIESTIYAPNIGAGTDDSVVVLNSSGNLVTDEIDSRVWGTTLVDGTGTTNYNAYWSDGNTLAAEQYVATSRGGLGANVIAAGAGELLYSTTTTTYGHLAAGTSGMALISGGAGAPSWGTLGLTYGGTNANLSGVDTGGLIYKGASALAGTAALSGIIQGNGASAPTAITGTANYIPKWSASAPYLTATSTIYDNGNVGIGTTAPAYKLDVNGNMRVSTLAGGSTDTVITHASGVLQTRSIDTRVWGSSLVDGSGATNRVAYWTDTETLTSSANFTFNGTYVATNEIRALSASGLSLIDDSGTATNGIFIQDGGNVGIGIVAPTTKLHVEGTITGQVFSDTNASYYLNPDSSATSLLVAGNVGIGITTPTAKLHIWQNAATDAFRVDDEGTAGDTTPFVVKDTGRVGIGAATPGGKLIVVGEGATTGITFQTQDSGNNALVTMLDNGNVGIGVTNPSQKFDVVGNIELNQNLYFANGSTEYLRWDTSDFILSDDFLPSAADTSNLGSTAAEWNSLYLANGTGLAAGGGLFLGSGQEFLLSYDSATALALKLSDGTNTFLSVKDQGTVADFAFNVDDFWISNTGNVGIGITSPIAKLHIYDASQNNLFRIANSTTDALFEVTQASMSANIPASFNAAGDTEIAYNLNFSNDTASYIRSLSPLYIEAGDSNSAEDLILRSRGTGDVIIGSSIDLSGDMSIKSTSDTGYGFNITTAGSGGTYGASRMWLTPTGASSQYPASYLVVSSYDNSQTNRSAALQLAISTTPAAEFVADSTNLYYDNLRNSSDTIFRNTTSYTERMRITTNGNVGIGTNTPTAKLEAAGIISTGGSYVMRAYSGASVPTRNNDGEFGYYMSGTTHRLYFRSGSTNSYINRTGGGDYSEYMLKANPNEDIIPGHIVTQEDTGRITKTSQNSQIPTGIISAFGTRNFDDLKNDGMRHLDKNYANVGLLGQLPLLVTSENGQILKGDFIKAGSIYNGFGVKGGNKAGYVVGQAIQSLTMNSTTCPLVNSIADINWPINIENENQDNICYRLPDNTYVGRIMTYLNTQWYDPDVYLASTGYLVISGQDQNYQLTDSETNTLIDRMGAFKELVVAKIRSGFITTKELVVETVATIQGNLSVLGNTSVSGTLTAQDITSPTITNIETNLQALTTKVNNLQSAMDAVITQDVNTGKYFMSAEALTTVNLTVQDGANIASINISGNTMSTPLAELNLKALEKVTFFNDRVLVNKDGSIMAKGEIVTQKGIKVINEAEETVASINASGSAYFAEGVTFDKNIASSSAVIAASQTFAEIGENTNSIVTNGEASGQAVLPAGQQELLIRNSKVKENSLIYISPEGSTSGQVLYLDTKKENEWFKVKVDEPSSADIKFNWWIL